LDGYEGQAATTRIWQRRRRSPAGRLRRRPHRSGSKDRRPPSRLQGRPQARGASERRVSARTETDNFV